VAVGAVADEGVYDALKRLGVKSAVSR
jgi:hypothetical protein